MNTNLGDGSLFINHPQKKKKKQTCDQTLDILKTFIW
jgi:hypothetical protein